MVKREIRIRLSQKVRLCISKTLLLISCEVMSAVVAAHFVVGFFFTTDIFVSGLAVRGAHRFAAVEYSGARLVRDQIETFHSILFDMLMRYKKSNRDFEFSAFLLPMVQHLGDSISRMKRHCLACLHQSLLFLLRPEIFKLSNILHSTVLCICTVDGYDQAGI